MKGVTNVHGSGGVQVETRTFKITADAVITSGDLVKLASGKIAVAGAGDAVYGIARQSVTGNAGGTTDILIALAKSGIRFWMDNDNTGTEMGTTHVGTKFDIVGATGEMQVDTSTTSTTGQLVLVQFDPDSDDASVGLYEFFEIGWLA